MRKQVKTYIFDKELDKGLVEKDKQEYKADASGLDAQELSKANMRMQ